MPYEITVTTEAEDAELLRRRVREEARRLRLRLASLEPKPVAPSLPHTTWYVEPGGRRQSGIVFGQMGSVLLVGTPQRRTKALDSEKFAFGVLSDPEKAARMGLLLMALLRYLKAGDWEKLLKLAGK